MAIWQQVARRHPPTGDEEAALSICRSVTYTRLAAAEPDRMLGSACCHPMRAPLSQVQLGQGTRRHLAGGASLTTDLETVDLDAEEGHDLLHPRTGTATQPDAAAASA